MSKLFIDRTDNDIKNKWYSMQRKNERSGKDDFKNPFANDTIVVDTAMDNSCDRTIPEFSNDSYFQRNWSRTTNAS
jgi:hypothetical protein